MAKARKRTESAGFSDSSGQSPEITPDTADDAAAGNGNGNGDPRDRVAMRAYELYLARGGEHGGDFDDWLAAEREIAGPTGPAGRGDAGE
jgi:hypothetical protein